MKKIIAVLFVLCLITGTSYADTPYTFKDVDAIPVQKLVEDIPYYQFVKVFSDDPVFQLEEYTRDENVLIDHRGKVIENRSYLEIDKNICSYYDHNDKHLMIHKVALDNNGKSKFDPTYTDLRYYKDSSAYVFQTKVENFYKYGVISENGQILVQPKYDFAGDIYHDLLPVQLGNKIGLIDKNGSKILNFEYENITVTNTDVFCVKKDGIWYLVDKKGNKIKNTESSKAIKFNNSKNPLGIIHQGTMYYVVDTKGNRVFEHSDDEFYATEVLNCNILEYVSNQDYKFIPLDKKSNKYDIYTIYEDGIIKIVDRTTGNFDDYKYGLANDKLEMIVPIEWDYILKQDDKVYYMTQQISPTNKKIIIYFANFDKYINEKDVKKHENTLYNTTYYIVADADNKNMQGVYTKDQILIKPMYKSIKYIDSGFVATDKNNKLLYFDFNGNMISEINKIEDAPIIKNGIAYTDNGWVDANGNVIVTGFSPRTDFINGYALVHSSTKGDSNYYIVSLEKIKKLGGIK